MVGDQWKTDTGGYDHRTGRHVSEPDVPRTTPAPPEPPARDRVYQRAWVLLQERILTKTGWGKNELASAMAECLQRAVDDIIG